MVYQAALESSGSQSVVPGVASTSTRTWQKWKFSGPTTDLLNQKLWEWGPALYSASPPCDSRIRTVGLKQSWVVHALILKRDKEVEEPQTTEMGNFECLRWKVKNKRILIVGETKGEQEPTWDRNTGLLEVKEWDITYHSPFLRVQAHPSPGVLQSLSSKALARKDHRAYFVNKIKILWTGVIAKLPPMIAFCPSFPLLHKICSEMNTTVQP